MPNERSRLVYSTDGEHVVADKTSTARARRDAPARRNASSGVGAAGAHVPDDGVVRLQRSKSGRGGKTVTLVTGLPGDERALDAMLKVLKQHCGAGGTREGRTLEIQGDHRPRLQAKLEALGHRVKLAGG